MIFLMVLDSSTAPAPAKSAVKRGTDAASSKTTSQAATKRSRTDE